MKFLAGLIFLIALTSADYVSAQSDQFESLFNGKDLTGWSYLPTTDAQKKGRDRWRKADPNSPPWPIVETKVNFDGKATTDDDRFVVENGNLVVAVPAEGRKIQMLYSDAVVSGDFELRLEFRAARNADSGVFIRGRQLQCRDYPNAGPYSELKKFKPGDWNELVVIVKGETARCTCNGEVLEEKFKVPATGPIGVEGDRGKLEYRKIRIRRLANNLLKPTNDVTSWSFEQFDAGKGTIKSESDTIVFETTQSGPENWHVQAYQTGLNLVEGSRYRLSFDIKADQANVVVYLQATIGESDWHNIGLYEEVYLGSDFESQEFTFTATDILKSNNRIGFAVGETVAKVTVKNIVLEQVD